MKKHIENFGRYLQEGYTIGQSVDIKNLSDYNNIVFVGMGGSAIALDLIKILLDKSGSSLPSQVIREYTVPAWVNDKTLMITASYSGNTEETVSAMHDGLEKGATMIAITSAGQLKKFADGNHILATMPTGIEPRGAMPYSLGVQLAIFEKLGHVSDITTSLTNFEQWIENNTQRIITETASIGEKIAHRMPFVYATTNHGPVATRAEQQIQENSRTLCHSHLIPEHNHNELLGRQEGSNIVDVIWFEQTGLTSREARRIELTKQVLNERNISQHIITMEGNDLLESILSGIYQADWLSYATAMVRGVDPSGSPIIEWFKKELDK